MRVIQAYRFALDPTPAQEQALRSHCGAQRFAYNWGLARITANLAQRAAERSYGIPEQELTPAASWSAWSLRKEFNAVKDQVAPGGRRTPRRPTPRGWRTWPPRWGTGRPAGTAPAKVRRCGSRCSRASGRPRASGSPPGRSGWPRQDRRHVRLPRIGLVRTHESTRTLARRVAGRDRADPVGDRLAAPGPLAGLVLRRSRPRPACPGQSWAIVGVDVGITHLAVLSTGQMIPNPRPLEQAQRRLRRLNRQAARRAGPDRRTGQRPSAALAQDPGQARPGARPRGEPARGRAAPAHHPARREPTARSWSRT